MIKYAIMDAIGDAFLYLEPRMEVAVRAATTMGILSDDVRSLFSSIVPGWRAEEFGYVPGAYDCVLRDVTIQACHGGMRVHRKDGCFELQSPALLPAHDGSMRPHATRAPALPVFQDSSRAAPVPVPRSSSSA